MSGSVSATTSRFTPNNWLKDFHVTNKILPNRAEDTRFKIVAKALLILGTLGLVFLVTLSIDVTKSLFNKLFGPTQPMKTLHKKDTKSQIQMTSIPESKKNETEKEKKIESTKKIENNIKTKDKTQEKSKSDAEAIEEAEKAVLKCMEKKDYKKRFFEHLEEHNVNLNDLLDKKEEIEKKNDDKCINEKNQEHSSYLGKGALFNIASRTLQGFRSAPIKLYEEIQNVEALHIKAFIVIGAAIPFWVASRSFLWGSVVPLSYYSFVIATHIVQNQCEEISNEIAEFKKSNPEHIEAAKKILSDVKRAKEIKV